MRTQPVWKQDELVPGDFLSHIIGETPIEAESPRVVDRRPRYVLNPFRNRALDSWYAMQYNIPPHPVLGCFIPERTILPLTMGAHPTIDYNSLKTDSLEASERYLPPGQRSSTTSDMTTEERFPLYNAMAMVSAFGNQYGMPTGFCQIVELDQVDDMSIALSVTRLCFPRARTTVDHDIENIDRVIEAGNVDDLTRAIVSRVLQAMNHNKAWAEEHYRRLIGQLDEHSGNPLLGKAKADRLDVAVCGWLGVPVPKSVSKTDQGGQQKIQVEMVGTPAQGTVPQIQCGECGTLVNLLPDGRAPKFCFACRTNFTEEVKIEEKSKPTAKKSIRPTNQS